jgi:large subunit ribosomal protein L25
MRKDISVAAEVRGTRGKNEARRTRRRGLIPAVLYGSFQDPVPIALSPKELLQILRSSTGYNTIFNLVVNGGETSPCMVVDEQFDPVKGSLLHADLKRIDLTKRLRVSVPVTTAGEPKGVKQQGGLLEVISRSVEIETVPDEIPDSFVVDVTELMMGQSKRASDVGLTGSMKLLSPPDAVIAHVVAMRAEEVAPAAAEVAPVAEATPAAGEPEVIKKGKKEEEAAEETKGKKK